MRKYILPAIALLVLVTALPVMAADEEDTTTSILKSAGVKGGEVAAKLLAGLLYDTSCVNRNNDQFTGYVCTILGSVSGRTEDKWKQEVTNQLKEINSKVDTLTVGQREIQRSLAEMKTDLNNKFNTVAQNVVAVQHLVKIEGLWEKYQAQFDKIDQDVSRDSMLSFAKEIVAEKPHTMLAELNAVLTQGIPATGGQPLVRYPLSEWRIAHSTGMGYEPKMMEAYDYAEKRFVDFRMREAEGLRDVSLGGERAGDAMQPAPRSVHAAAPLDEGFQGRLEPLHTAAGGRVQLRSRLVPALLQPLPHDHQSKLSLRGQVGRRHATRQLPDLHPAR